MKNNKMQVLRLPKAAFGLCFLVLTCFEKTALCQNETSTPAPTTVTADICNMSLITSVEVDAVQKQCKCEAQNMEVDCSNLELTELPKLISFPKNVRIANFEANKIGSLNPDTFYNGRDVSELDLSFNEIDFVSSKAFQAFKNLKRLDLSHNRLWNIPTNAFHGLTGLRRLDLSFNDLLTVFPEIFSTLNELRELVLKSNPLHELASKHFEHLQKLELLDLESTMLKVLPDHVFFFTPKLKHLILAQNQLTNVPTEALHVLDHLKILDMSGNAFEVIEPEAFRGMTGLVILYLERMSSLERIEKYAFGDLVHLQELHCSYNALLSEIDPNAFVRKVNNEKVQLSQLFLRQNDLTTVPQFLLDWNNGMELHVRDNPLNCDCNMEWMVNTKLKNNFQAQVKCSSPDEFEGMTLSQLKNHDLVCGMHLSEIVMIACAVVTALLIITLIIAFLLWRRSYSGYRKPYFNGYSNKHVNDVEYRGGDDDI